MNYFVQLPVSREWSPPWGGGLTLSALWLPASLPLEETGSPSCHHLCLPPSVGVRLLACPPPPPRHTPTLLRPRWGRVLATARSPTPPPWRGPPRALSSAAFCPGWGRSRERGPPPSAGAYLKGAVDPSGAASSRPRPPTTQDDPDSRLLEVRGGGVPACESRGSRRSPEPAPGRQPVVWTRCQEPRRSEQSRAEGSAGETPERSCAAALGSPREERRGESKRCSLQKGWALW